MLTAHARLRDTTTTCHKYNEIQSREIVLEQGNIELHSYGSILENLIPLRIDALGNSSDKTEEIGPSKTSAVHNESANRPNQFQSEGINNSNDSQVRRYKDIVLEIISRT